MWILYDIMYIELLKFEGLYMYRLFGFYMVFYICSWSSVLWNCVFLATCKVCSCGTVVFGTPFLCKIAS